MYTYTKPIQRGNRIRNSEIIQCALSYRPRLFRGIAGIQQQGSTCLVETLRPSAVCKTRDKPFGQQFSHFRGNKYSLARAIDSHTKVSLLWFPFFADIRNRYYHNYGVCTQAFVLSQNKVRIATKPNFIIFVAFLNDFILFSKVR